MIYFIFHSVITRIPELIIKSIERFSSSCSAEREAIKHSENSAKPEVDFEPNRGEIVFGIFLPKKAVLAETNYSPFLFLLGPIYGQNTSEINFSTCATDRRFRSIFMGIHSSELFVGRLEEYERALLFVARILKSTTTNGSFRNVEDPGNISPSEPCFSR